MEGDPRKIGGSFWWYGSPPVQFALAVSYSGADGRIRLGDSPFTNHRLSS
jgi:hypothetical protein